MHVGGPGRSQRPSAGDSERSPRTARKTRKTQGAGHDRKRSNSARTGGRTCRTPAEPLLVCLARPNFSDGLSSSPGPRAAPFYRCGKMHGKMGMWLEGGFNVRTLKNGTQAAPHRGCRRGRRAVGDHISELSAAGVCTVGPRGKPSLAIPASPRTVPAHAAACRACSPVVLEAQVPQRPAGGPDRRLGGRPAALS